MFFCILTQIVPHPSGGKVDAALPSSATFCYNAFAVVLSVQRFLNLVPTEACRMVPNCELETGIVQCNVCCFLSKICAFKNWIQVRVPCTWGLSRYSIAWPQTPVVSRTSSARRGTAIQRVHFLHRKMECCWGCVCVMAFRSFHFHTRCTVSLLLLLLHRFLSALQDKGLEPWIAGSSIWYCS